MNEGDHLLVGTGRHSPKRCWCEKGYAQAVSESNGTVAG